TTSRRAQSRSGRKTIRPSSASSSSRSRTTSTSSWKQSPRKRRSSRRRASSRDDTGGCLAAPRSLGCSKRPGFPGALLCSLARVATLTSAPPILRTEALTIRFGGLAALSAVSLAGPAGEIRGIIGPNGAGKSTFFNCLTGVLRPTSGRIVFNGEDIAGLPPHAVSRKAIARSYQITNILPGATVLENVRIASQSRHHNWSMLRHHRAFTDVIDRARAVLADVGVAQKEDELASNLSPAHHPNLATRIALATEPKLLCLDEPTAGMSVTETHATVDLI